MRTKYGWPLIVFLASRAVVGVALFALTLVSKYDSALFILTRWDGVWYLAIARSGYPRLQSGVATPGAEAVAFFPGYPLAIRAISAVTPLAPELTGVLISTAAAAVACVLLWTLAERVADKHVADRTVALFCFFPSAFILSMVYADALFIALALGCLLLLLNQRWLAAGLVAAAASVVRPNGILLVACCAWAAVSAIRRSRVWRPLLAPVVATIGIVAQTAYLQIHTGNAFAFYEVEDKLFDQRFDLGVSNVHRLFKLLGGGGSGMASTFQLLMLTLAIPCAVVVAHLVYRAHMPTVINIYVLGIAALAFLGSNTTSVPRFLLAACPAFIAVAKALSERAYSMVLAGTAAVMISLFFVVSATLLLPA